MSLPDPKKDISAKPAKGSVIDPVNKKLKDADVDRKIRFYSVLQAFGANKYPANTQIDDTLKYVLSHSPVEQEKLSEDGKKLIADVQKIITTAQEIVKVKNGDELIQSWLYGTRSEIDVNTHLETAKGHAGGLKESAPDEEKRKEDSRQAVQHLRTLFQLILTNSEVRKLISDTGLVGRDLLARGASKAAGKIAPSSEALANVDESAPRDAFVHDEKADHILKGRIPGFGKKPKELKEEKKSEFHSEYQTQADDLENEIRDVDGQDSLTSEQKEQKKNKLKDRLKALSLSPENQEKLNAQKERTKTFLMEEYFPKERRDQWIYRLKKVIIECQKHEDYQESLKWLLGAVEEYGRHGKTAVSGTDASSVTTDPALRTSLSQLREILERFANGKSLDGVFAAFDSLSHSAREDAELRSWFKQVDEYARKVLFDAGYVIEPQCNKRGAEIRDSGKQFYDVKYRAQFDGLFRTIQDWFLGMKEDPLNAKFGQDWARLTKDLLFDDQGSLKFKKHLWSDIRSTILPQLVDKIGYIPIPRIEYTDDAFDLVVENLVLSGRNIFPNVITLEAHNFVKFSPYTAIKDEHRHEIKLSLGQIQADMRDVAFYFRKKSGFPKTKDSGLADVVLGGEGVTATIHLVSSPANDDTSLFTVKSCVVKVDSLKFSIRDSKHDILYKALKPLATGLIKKQIQKAIQDALVTGLSLVDGQLVGVKQRMAEAKAKAKAQAAVASDGSSQMSEQSRLKLFKDAFKSPVSDATSTHDTATVGGVSMKSAKRSSSQFKVVSDKRKSILAEGTGHPSGWVNRTAERAELATKDEGGWKSPVFDVVGKPVGVDAAKSSNGTNGSGTNGAAKVAV